VQTLRTCPQSITDAEKEQRASLSMTNLLKTFRCRCIFSFLTVLVKIVFDILESGIEHRFLPSLGNSDSSVVSLWKAAPWSKLAVAASNFQTIAMNGQRGQRLHVKLNLT
jgi:hypothetical protein